MEEGTQHRPSLGGVLLGTAVGDALGLPAENLRPEVIEALGWRAWRHRFFWGRGMVSDDTEHTVFVGQSLLEAGEEDVEAFQTQLAKKLRLWVLCLPAGVGFATLRACFKLWLGFGPKRSGVFSAGNGPAMRSALLGAFFAGDDEKLARFVKAATTLTHTDPKATIGAMAVALCAAHAHEPESWEEWLVIPEADDDWNTLLQQMKEAWEREDSVETFAHSLGLARGVSGYVYHTVPVAIYAWRRHFGDFAKTLTSVLNLGGDTDSTGAIVGAIAGASVAEEGIPPSWVQGIWDWPRGLPLLRRLQAALQTAQHDELSPTQRNNLRRQTSASWLASLLRNTFFFCIVLTHIALRLLPKRLRRLLG